MFGIGSLIAMAAAALIAKKLEESSEYKEPKGKNKNRYK